jgi:LysM repeat protein/uncharacterized protein YvpB
MERAEHGRAPVASESESRRRQPGDATAIGASYVFDPAADGLAGIYARRVLERGIDPRVLCAEVRADRLGVADRGVMPRAGARSRLIRFGRGTAAHLTAAGLVALLLLPLGAFGAAAHDAPMQSRYIVEAGDTLDVVAAEFGVDPAAILAASALANPPRLTAGEIIVIPAASESPEEAASNAARRTGTSPFVAFAHDVAPGETLAEVAATHGLDPWALAAFNGIADIDSISSGQRLRIPLIDTVVAPEAVDDGYVEPGEIESTELVAAEWDADSEFVADGVGGGAPDWEEPAGPVIATDVPAYLQAFSLSCEYAAAYIATAGFGWGVPESAFIERIGQSPNPHWGYRGSIYGAWGGTDDYGVYPEALVPTLNEFGFAGDIFYSGGDASALTSRLDAGMPVLTWLGYFGDTAWAQEDEGSYLLAPGMHVVVAYGYDDGGVYVSNPGRGIHDYYAWGDFLAMWSVLDGMALGVAPMA